MPRSTAQRGARRALKLIEIHREDIESLPALMALLRDAPYRFLVFCDDLSFDGDDTSYKSLKAVLEGGIEGRPANVLFYATSNRRHLMPRDMMDNERSTAINPGEAVEEKVSLSDRFGLWLGFHHCSQDEYLAMVFGYADHFGLDAPRDQIGARRARMGDDARLALRPHGLAVHPGSGRTPRAPDRRIVAKAAGLSLDPPLSFYAHRPNVSRGRPTGALQVHASRLDFECPAGTSEAGEIARGIDRRRTLAQLEVQLRRRDVAGLAGFGDDLAALDRIAALDVEFAIVGVSGDEAVGMADQHEIAIALELAAGIGDDAGLGGLDRGALGTAMLMPSLPPLEALNDASARRPAEFRVAPAASAWTPVRAVAGAGASAWTLPVGAVSATIAFFLAGAAVCGALSALATTPGLDAFPELAGLATGPGSPPLCFSCAVAASASLSLASFSFSDLVLASLAFALLFDGAASSLFASATFLAAAVLFETLGAGSSFALAEAVLPAAS